MPDLSWFALCSRHICSNTCHVMPSPMFTYQPLANIRESQHWGRREGVYTREKWNKFSGWEGVTWKILSFSLAPFGSILKLASTTANSLTTCIVQLGLWVFIFRLEFFPCSSMLTELLFFYSSLPFFRWILVFRIELFSKLCQPLLGVLFSPCSSLFTQIEKLAKYFPLSVLVLP